MSGSNNRSRLASTRRKILGTIGAGSVVGMAGCLGGDDDNDGNGNGNGGSNTLRYGLVGQIDTLDEAFSTSAEDSIVYNTFYEGLTRTGVDGAIYNWHASSSEIVDVQDVGFADYEPYMEEVPFNDEGVAVPDEQVVGGGQLEDAEQGIALTVSGAKDAALDGVYGVQINYQLHEGIEFHNGEELTAEHYVNSLTRLENSDLSGQIFDAVLAYEAAGDYELNAYGTFPNAEAQRELPINVYSNEQYDLPDGEMDPREGNTPIGTGPYQITDYDDGNYWTLEKFDNYWLEDIGVENKEWGEGLDEFPDGPRPEVVELDVVLEPSTRTGALQNREIDMTHDLSVDQRNQFDSASGFAVYSTDQTGFTFFQLPAEASDAPFMDQDVRQAFNHSIPRGEIVDRIRDGWASIAEVPIPKPAAGEVIDDYDTYAEETARPLVEYDIDQAESLLQGSDAETPVSTTIVTNSDDEDRVSVANTVQQIMNDSDLWDITVETEPDLDSLVGRFSTEESYQNNEVILIGLGGGFNPLPYIQVLHSPEVYLACCQWMNFGANDGVDIDRIMDPLNESNSLEAVQDPSYRQELFQDEAIPAALEEAANCIVDYEVQTVAVNSRDIKNGAAYTNPQGLLIHNLYAPFDEVAVEIDRG